MILLQIYISKIFKGREIVNFTGRKRLKAFSLQCEEEWRCDSVGRDSMGTHQGAGVYD